jgi:hypoxanthine-DNA glycosylase
LKAQLQPQVRLLGLAPVVDERVTTLILGSFPGAASLAAAHYYAHPRNQFWRILGELIGVALSQLPYPQRLQQILDHRIGLWDVYASCVRRGSLDAEIAAARANDLDALRHAAPRLRAVIFNGRTAGRLEPALRCWGVACAVLPSTSPAHAALGFDAKLAIWRQFYARQHAECGADA